MLGLELRIAQGLGIGFRVRDGVGFRVKVGLGLRVRVGNSLPPSLPAGKRWGEDVMFHPHFFR